MWPLFQSTLIPATVKTPNSSLCILCHSTAKGHHGAAEVGRKGLFHAIRLALLPLFSKVLQSLAVPLAILITQPCAKFPAASIMSATRRAILAGAVIPAEQIEN